MTKRFRGLGAIVLLVALFVAGSASAVVRQMSGRWIMHRGPAVNIPVNPGFVPGMGTVIEGTGAAPRALTIPANRFNEVGGGALFPLPGATLIQLSTMLDEMGPQVAGMIFGGVKGSRPNNFAWCPNLVQGAGVGPACPNGNFNAGIGRPGIVRYTAGPNQFGGTMQILLIGGGEVSVTDGTSGGMPVILHNPFGGAGGSVPQQAGGAYKNTGMVDLAAGPRTVQPVMPTGVIITPGPAAVPPLGMTEMNITTGFPWTTGKVEVQNPTAVSIAGPGGTMLTLTGKDNRGMGGGHVVLVAGATTKRTITNNTYMHLDIVDMTLDPQVPALSAGGFAAAAALVLLAAGYFLRRRLA